MQDSKVLVLNRQLYVRLTHFYGFSFEENYGLAKYL